MIRTLASLLSAMAIAACGEPSKEVIGPPAAWTLVWEDDFLGSAGTKPDPSRWVHDIGGSGWGNAQLEYDSNSTDNVAIDGEGHLLITARQQSISTNHFTSGRIKTLGLFSQKYGRVEALIKLPAGRGIWPAFWMLGADQPTAGWPDCGEIDILEMRGQEPSVIIGSLHGPGYSGGASISSRLRLTEGRFDTDFHLFAVEWDPNRITFLVDDEPYQTVTAGTVLAKGRWVFDHDFFLLLNVAVGGNFVGSPDATTTFPQSMVVDFVRVYRRSP